MKREAVCPVCGKRFLADRCTQRYCAEKCRKKAHRKKTGEDRAGPEGTPVLRSFLCARCGKPVAVTDPKDRRSKFCSGRCERLYWKHRRAEKKDAGIPVSEQMSDQKTIGQRQEE